VKKVLLVDDALQNSKQQQTAQINNWFYIFILHSHISMTQLIDSLRIKKKLGTTTQCKISIHNNESMKRSKTTSHKEKAAYIKWPLSYTRQQKWSSDPSRVFGIPVF
jgi:hypothetical protein